MPRANWPLTSRTMRQRCGMLAVALAALVGVSLLDWPGQSNGHGAASADDRPASAAPFRQASASGTTAVAAAAARAISRGGVTGLPLPRFASLRSDPVNLRKGPGTEYPLAWVYQRAGLPVEIMQEFDGWRQVRDWEGATGWVLGALLSGRRTAIVQPWAGQAQRRLPLLESRRASASLVAELEPGTVASIKSCDGAWCDVTVANYRGYLEQRWLWGVYPGEKLR